MTSVLSGRLIGAGCGEYLHNWPFKLSCSPAAAFKYRPRKEKMFCFSICDVRQFISRRTFCQPLSSPLLCSLWWCLPQFSCLSLASFLLSLLCLPAFCFLLLLCIHGCFHISVCYLSFASFPLPPSCLLLSCLFLYIIYWHNAFVSFSLCVSFAFVFCLVFSFHVSSWFPPGCSVRFILAVYCWRKCWCHLNGTFLTLTKIAIHFHRGLEYFVF